MTAAVEIGWGAGPWGETPWGTGEGELELLSAIAVRENAVRVEFSVAPVLDGLLTPHDASSPERFSVATVSGAGPDGEIVRPVLPVLVEVAPVVGGAGRFLDVWVDRRFTGYPAVYRVSANGLISEGGSILAAGASATFFGVQAGTAPPTPENSLASRDFLVAQVVRDLDGANVALTDPEKLLGAFVIDGSGDYASSTPLSSYRMRVIRRAIATLGSYAHLSTGYGTLLSRSAKQAFKQSTGEDIAAQIEAQVRLEPETTAVTVTVSSTDTGVTTYKIFARSRVGDVTVDVPG
jgi:hypothetical protein